MTTTEDSVFDAYRDAVEQPIYRLFAEYGFSHYEDWSRNIASVIPN